MQKAYGVSSKDLPVKTKTSSSSTKSSVKSSGATPTTGDAANRGNKNANPVGSQRTRHSTDAVNSSLKPEGIGPSRRSYPGETNNSKASSKIIAASKANYAEKYGGARRNSIDHKNRANPVPITSQRRTSNSNNSTAAGSGNSSPYRMKSPSKVNRN